MTDVFSKTKRSLVMAAVRGKQNKSTELKLLKLFRKNYIRGWRRNWPIEGRPDFIFPEKRLAVFVDGCFWHGCPKHLRRPKSNIKYWRSKIASNRARDIKVKTELGQRGWRVLRIWEHELKNEDSFLKRIRRVLEA